MVVTNEDGTKLVHLEICAGDGTLGLRMLMDAKAAKAMATALHQSGVAADSGVVVAQAIPAVGRA